MAVIRLWTGNYGHPRLWITLRGERPVDKRRSIPPPGRGRPRTDPPGPRRRADRCARAPQRATSDGYARGSPSGTSHRSRRGRRPGCQDPGLGHWARRRGPPALLALLRRRALSTTCMGYQHRRALYPPRGDNNPLTMSTTPSRCRQRTPVRGAPPPCEPTGRIPRSGAPPPPVTHTRTPIYETSDAHNGLIPPLCATPRSLIPSLVCDTETNARPGR